MFLLFPAEKTINIEGFGAKSAYSDEAGAITYWQWCKYSRPGTIEVGNEKDES
jgi:hypothetical protein